MDGLMMDYQLNVPAILRRADELYGDREIVSRQPDKSWHRYTYADFVSRTKKLIVALRTLGLEDGDRIGTFMWNHSQHLEAYIGAPAGGLVTHTLNLRLHPDDNTYIATHAGDRVLLVDKVLWPLAEQFVPRCSLEHVIAVGDGPAPEGTIDYEDLLADADESEFVYRDLDERSAAAMCYTSGTTGRPKGVLYSHRAIAIHALTINACLGVTADDVSLPVVPMFHANAWCFPFSSTMVGARQVFPGPHMDPITLLDGLAEQKVTITAGVPTIWMGILQALDANPQGWDLSSIRIMTVGGAAPPRAMIEAFSERHGLHVVHGWGMTEMTPVGTVGAPPANWDEMSDQEQVDYMSRPGRSMFGVELRTVGAEGNVLPRDGVSSGRLQTRGAAVVRRYFKQDQDCVEEDQWFDTGDMAAIHPDGTIQITDRAKDVIKSGGEWISSIELENAAVGCPGVLEAAAIGIPHPKWDERPLLLVVRDDDSNVSEGQIRDFLSNEVAKWWLPDAIEFVEELPHTATGKLSKKDLRDKYRDYRFENAEAMVGRD